MGQDQQQLSIYQYVAQKVVDAARGVFKPRSGLEVWEWAEENIYLPARVTRYPGWIKFSRTPYMVGEWSPLWAFRRYRQVDNIWAAQAGKTLMMQCTICYVIAVDPGPGMLVYPDRHTARRRSHNHMRPMVQENLPSFLTGDEDDMQLLEYTTKTCTINLGWAGSPSVLAGEPERYIWGDEEAKWKEKTEKEARSKDLAMRRQISFGEYATWFGCTTPSLAHLPGWADWSHSTQCQCYVPCPHCAEADRALDDNGERNTGWQVMYFSNVDRRWFVDTKHESDQDWTGGIKWDRDESLSKDERAATAYYECRDCGGHWNDLQVNAAVRIGQWVPKYPNAKRYTSHLPSWYAPWVKIGEVVERWWSSYKDEEKRHDFLNSDCAVPYEEEGKSVDRSHLTKHILKGHHTGKMPMDAVVNILTADVHDDHIRYRVRAHKPDGTSWGVEEGQLMAELEALDGVLARTYQRRDQQVGISAGLIDARWRTDEVNQFCLRHDGVMWPAMGEESQREAVQYKNRYVPANVDKGLYLEGEVCVVHFNDPRWKQLLFNTLNISPGEAGYWYLEEEVSEEFLWQLEGEVKREKRNKKNQLQVEWHLLHDNHALDCEKMQLLAQSVFQLGSLAMPQEPSKTDHGPQINPYTGQEV